MNIETKNINIGIITQARIGSSRLPGKTLKEIQNVSILEYHLRRLKESNLSVFLATTHEKDSFRLIDAANRLGIPTFQGSTNDVLSRFYHCAQKFALDVVVRVTSDCPLIDGMMIKQGVHQFLSFPNWKSIFLTNALERNVPRGFDFEVFSFDALKDAYTNGNTDTEREHVTPYIYRSHSYQIVNFQSEFSSTARGSYRLTVDTQEDFELIRLLIETHNAANLDSGALTDLLDRHPELRKINANVQQKAI
jgi:spore coat polysaccharide biosynthesis protein SpsF